jgi:hypothetical protein
MYQYFGKSTNLLVCPTAKQPIPAGLITDYVGAGSQNGTANYSYYRGLDSTAALYPAIQSVIASYTYNGWLYTSGQGSGGSGDGSTDVEQPHGISDPAWFYRKDTSMQKASLTPVFCDGPWVDTWPAEDDGPAQDLWTGSFSAHKNEMGRVTVLRHGGRPLTGSSKIASASGLPAKGGIIMSFGDGHAELTTLPHLWTYYWHNDWAQVVRVNIGAPQP